MGCRRDRLAAGVATSQSSESKALDKAFHLSELAGGTCCAQLGSYWLREASPGWQRSDGSLDGEERATCCSPADQMRAGRH